MSTLRSCRTFLVFSSKLEYCVIVSPRDASEAHGGQALLCSQSALTKPTTTARPFSPNTTKPNNNAPTNPFVRPSSVVVVVVVVAVLLQFRKQKHPLHHTTDPFLSPQSD